MRLIVKVLLKVLLPGLGAMGLGLAAFVWMTVMSLTQDQIEAALTRPTVAVVVSEGRILSAVCNCVRTLRADEMPSAAEAALVATEDRRFYEHGAVDLRAWMRATLSSAQHVLTGQGQVEGGSTLTQQLVKQSIVGSDRTLMRKLVEAAYAWRIESIYGKEDILRLYLSRVDFGWVGGAPVFGLREAAQVYFGKEPKRLSVPEIAILVGMLKGTYTYSPLHDPDASQARAETVLALMRRQGRAGPTSRAAIARAMPGRAADKPTRRRYVEDEIQREFLDAAPVGGWPDGVYRVVSTLDPIAQWRADQFMHDEIDRAGPAGITQGALISIDREGRVLAMVGGLEYGRLTYNAAMRGKRQAASTAKIATYLAALEAGWTPSSKVWDSPDRIRGRAPRNDDNVYRGRISLSECLTESRNACTVWLAEQVGFRKVADMATRIGLTLKPERGSDIVLGATETTPARLAAAFGVLTNGGTRVTAHAIAAIIGPLGMGQRLPPAETFATGLSEKTMTAMLGLLGNVVQRGTGRRAAFHGTRAYGKTGTSEGFRDAWFVGFTDDGITTAVWLGPDDGAHMSNIYGGSVPARIFSRFNASLFERFRAYSAGDALPR